MKVGDKKIDKVEKSKRIRKVMDWILEDWPSGDIVLKAMKQWNITDRQGRRYLADARAAWMEDEEAILEQRRRLKVESLKKLKGTMKEKYKGTPFGIRAILAVEKQIILLEGLQPPAKIQLQGDRENPIPIDLPPQKLVLSRLTDEELQQIIALNKKASGV